MMSRFGASHGSQSQPWLSPKRLISSCQSPSRRCPIGIKLTIAALPELRPDSTTSYTWLLVVKNAKGSSRQTSFWLNLGANTNTDAARELGIGLSENPKHYKDSKAINGAMSKKLTSPSWLVSA